MGPRMYIHKTFLKNVLNQVVKIVRKFKNKYNSYLYLTILVGIESENVMQFLMLCLYLRNILRIIFAQLF